MKRCFCIPFIAIDETYLLIAESEELFAYVREVEALRVRRKIVHSDFSVEFSALLKFRSQERNLDYTD